MNTLRAAAAGATNITANSDKKDVFHPTELEEGVSNLDAQRIISILNEAEKKIQLINMLPASIDKKVNSVFGLDSISIIKVNLFFIGQYCWTMRNSIAWHA